MVDVAARTDLRMYAHIYHEGEVKKRWNVAVFYSNTENNGTDSY
jgi:hypothetical protein